MTLPILLSLLLAAQSSAALRMPSFAAPTKDAAASTAQETAVLKAGIALHDQHRYDDAIAKYQEVLNASPDNASALYEMAYSALAKKDYQHAIDLAARGTTYKGQSAQFYVLIAQAFETSGDPASAVDVYKKGIELTPGSGTLYYNMSVTLQGPLKDPAGAKDALKKGAVADPAHALTQFQLGRTFHTAGYKTLELFALSRFLILEPGTQRTGQVLPAWLGLLNGSLAANQTGGVNLNVNPALVKTEEGNLFQMDMFVSLSKVTESKLAAGKSQIVQLVEQVTQLLKVDASQKPGDDKDTFLWTYYMPYFSDMSARDLVEPFIYYVCQHTDIAGAREWAAAHPDKIQDFVQWNKTYAWPKT